MNEHKSRFEDLRLLPGQPLQLDFDGYKAIRDKSLLIGYRAGQGLIVSTPLVNGTALPLKVGEQLSVRLFAQQLNCACAFRSQVVHVSRTPYAHLHLAQPEALTLGEVRSSVRARVSLICSLNHGEGFTGKLACMLKDISLGGCRLQAPKMPVVPGEKVRLTMQVSVSGIERIVSLEGEVRSLQDDEDSLFAGIQFASMSDGDRITLHAFVLSNLHAF